MRNAKLVERIAFDPAVFIRYFNTALQSIRSNDELKNLSGTLKKIGDSQWRLEIMDSLNQSCSLTLLHSLVLSIIFYSPSDEMRLSLLIELIAASPFELWEIKPPISQSSAVISETFKLTPREALLQLCKDPNGKVYLCALSDLLYNMPLEVWAKDIAEYLKFAKKLFLIAGGNIPIELTSFVDVLSRNSFADIQVWFVPTLQESGSEMTGNISLLSVVMNSLGKLIQTIDKNIQEAQAAGTLQDFTNTLECIVQRRGATYLIRVIYEIAKRSSTHHWDPVVDVDALSVSTAPLNELLDLMLIGFSHELMMKIAHHVLSKASRQAIEFISLEQKEKIAQINEFSGIVSALEGREAPVVDLMDTLYLFSENCSRSYLLLLVVTSEEYVSRLMQLTEAEIIQTQVGAFSNIANDQWVLELVDRNCPPKFVGLTLLHAIILVLIEKLSNPDFLSFALMSLVECVPATAWDQPASGKKVSTGAKSSSDIANSPRRLIWNLCRRENGCFFLSILYPVLNHIPPEQWQAEIPDYLRLVLKLFLKQGAELEFTVAAFFSLLISRSPVEENNFFSQFDLNTDEKQKQKQKQKDSAVVNTSPVCILIDTFNAILKKMPYNPRTCSVLTTSLKLIAERSSADDWDPGLMLDGTLDRNGPLNRLVKLLLDDSQNPYLSEIVEAVLAKASQESVDYISRENREKILAMPQFAKNKKLLDASREKKRVPKASAVKIAPKPVAKKALVPAPTFKSAKKPVGKKTLPKPSAKPSAKLEKTNTDAVTPESVASVADQRLMEALVSTCQQNSPKNGDSDGSDDDSWYIKAPTNLVRPTLRGSWADDSDFELGDSVSKKSVRYRHEPYSLFFNRKVIVKSGHDVTVSDVACIKHK